MSERSDDRVDVSEVREVIEMSERGEWMREECDDGVSERGE